jgi:hypothetical protein
MPTADSMEVRGPYVEGSAAAAAPPAAALWADAALRVGVARNIANKTRGNKDLLLMNWPSGYVRAPAGLPSKKYTRPNTNFGQAMDSITAHGGPDEAIVTYMFQIAALASPVHRRRLYDIVVLALIDGDGDLNLSGKLTMYEITDVSPSIQECTTVLDGIKATEDDAYTSIICDSAVRVHQFESVDDIVRAYITGNGSEEEKENEIRAATEIMEIMTQKAWWMGILRGLLEDVEHGGYVGWGRGRITSINVTHPKFKDYIEMYATYTYSMPFKKSDAQIVEHFEAVNAGRGDRDCLRALATVLVARHGKDGAKAVINAVTRETDIALTADADGSLVQRAVYALRQSATEKRCAIMAAAGGAADDDDMVEAMVGAVREGVAGTSDPQLLHSRHIKLINALVKIQFCALASGGANRAYFKKLIEIRGTLTIICNMGGIMNTNADENPLVAHNKDATISALRRHPWLRTSGFVPVVDDTPAGTAQYAACFGLSDIQWTDTTALFKESDMCVVGSARWYKTVLSKITSDWRVVVKELIDLCTINDLDRVLLVSLEQHCRRVPPETWSAPGVGRTSARVGETLEVRPDAGFNFTVLEFRWQQRVEEAWDTQHVTSVPRMVAGADDVGLWRCVAVGDGRALESSGMCTVGTPVTEASEWMVVDARAREAWEEAERMRHGQHAPYDLRALVAKYNAHVFDAKTQREGALPTHLDVRYDAVAQIYSVLQWSMNHTALRLSTADSAMIVHGVQLLRKTALAVGARAFADARLCEAVSRGMSHAVARDLGYNYVTVRGAGLPTKRPRGVKMRDASGAAHARAARVFPYAESSIVVECADIMADIHVRMQEACAITNSAARVGDIVTAFWAARAGTIWAHVCNEIVRAECVGTYAYGRFKDLLRASPPELEAEWMRHYVSAPVDPPPARPAALLDVLF